MKILLIVTVLLVAHARANFFTNFAHRLKANFSTLGTSLLHMLDKEGTNLLNKALSTGSDLLSQGVQVLAINAANAINKEKHPNGGTRDISLPPVFQNMETELHGVLQTLVSELKNVFQFLVQGFHGVFDKITNFVMSPDEVVKEIDSLVGIHNLLADTFLHTIVSKAEAIVAKLMSHKRNVATDFMANIGTQLKTLMTPMIEGLKTMATTAGETFKAVSKEMMDKAKTSFSQLKDSLKPHMDKLHNLGIDMMNHGLDAFNAATHAGSDILQQTMHNVGETAGETVDKILSGLTN